MGIISVIYKLIILGKTERKEKQKSKSRIRGIFEYAFSIEQHYSNTEIISIDYGRNNSIH